MSTSVINSKHYQILSAEELGVLNERSDRKGLLQLAGHLGIMGVSGYLWISHLTNLPIAIPAVIVYGFSLASMFAPMHEATHRTAFENDRLNKLVAWFAGLLSFYNSTFYRRYHKWHHRYTQILDKDPELGDLTLNNFGDYLLEISGKNWWIGKTKTHFRIAFGQVEQYPYISEAAQKEVIFSVRLQLLTYLSAIAISIVFGQPWFFLYWLLPLIIGQPILRLILMAEHTNCANEANPLTNTRTTLTLWPIRFLMWNMPYHAEHHMYASIPFHALPDAHQKLGTHFRHVEPGYVTVNRKIITQLGQ